MEGGNAVDSKGPAPTDEGSSVMMKVLFFVSEHDLTGVSDVHFKVLSGSSLLERAHRSPSRPEGDLRLHGVGLNEEYARESAIVKENDELAIIPPISVV